MKRKKKFDHNFSYKLCVCLQNLYHVTLRKVNLPSWTKELVEFWVTLHRNS